MAERLPSCLHSHLNQLSSLEWLTREKSSSTLLILSMNWTTREEEVRVLGTKKSLLTFHALSRIRELKEMQMEDRDFHICSLPIMRLSNSQWMQEIQQLNHKGMRHPHLMHLKARGNLNNAKVNSVVIWSHPLCQLSTNLWLDQQGKKDLASKLQLEQDWRLIAFLMLGLLKLMTNGTLT